MIISEDGENWLKQNLGINATDLTSPQGKIMRRTNSAKPRPMTAHKDHNYGGLGGAYGRPGSARMSVAGSQVS